MQCPSTFQLFSWVFLSSLLLSVAGFGSPTNPVESLQVESLQVAQPPSVRAISANSHHRWTFDVPAGHWIVAVEQLEGDVVLALRDSEDEPLGEIDGLFEAQGVERFAWANQAPMIGSVAVRLRTGFGRGRYRIQLLKAPADKRRWEAEVASTRAALAGRDALGGADQEQLERALQTAAEAHLQWYAVEDPQRVAESLHALALLHKFLDRRQEARRLFEQAAMAWQELAADSFQATALNSLALLRRDVGDVNTARDLLRQAEVLYRQGGNDYGAQVAALNGCRLVHHEGKVQEAQDCYLSSLSYFQQAEVALHLGNLLNSLGGTFYQLGEPAKARSYFSQSLEQHRLSGNVRERAATLNNRAALERYLGYWGAAVDDFGKALKLQREVGDKGGEARALNNLGHGLLALGDLEAAAQYLEQALTLRNAVEDRAGQAVTLNNLGTLYHQRGNAAKALAFRRRALEIRRDLGLRRHQALTHIWIGRDLRALGRPAEGLAELDRALLLLPETGDRRFEARAASDRGVLLIELGRLSEGLASLERGLLQQQAIGDLWGEVESRVALASGELRRGRLEAARIQAEAAIARVESLRFGVADIETRSTFLAAKRRAFELAIEVAMAQHAVDPAAGFDRQALAFNEASRARALLDLLSEARSRSRRIRGPVDEAQRLAEELAWMTTRRLRATSRSSQRQALAAMDARIAMLEERIDGLPSSGSGPGVDRAEGDTLGATAIRDLLDPGTVLLEFALGETKSFLWTVSAHSVRSYELPRREILEDLALAAHRGLATLDLNVAASGEAPSADPSLQELSDLLLGPLSQSLREDFVDHRLIVVADGALNYLPFAALRLPFEPNTYLIERHEIVHLPSASTLAVLRQQRWKRHGVPHATDAKSSPMRPDVFLLADPVFGRTDVRLRDNPPAAEIAHGPASSWQEDLVRLPGTRREASSIAALLPEASIELATGFDASLAKVFDPAVQAAKRLHFATHGVIDARQPSAAGLMLSRWDPQGLPIDGFLSLDRIEDLRLEADLVVLSGCRTALGKEVRGEGLVGLGRGFLQAGAQAVVASLWSVDDRSTATLMQRFYQALLSDGLPPAAALRKAQLSLLQSRELRDPFHWAAFVMQGDGAIGSAKPTVP